MRLRCASLTLRVALCAFVRLALCIGNRYRIDKNNIIDKPTGECIARGKRCKTAIILLLYRHHDDNNDVTILFLSIIYFRVGARALLSQSVGRRKTVKIRLENDYRVVHACCDTIIIVLPAKKLCDKLIEKKKKTVPLDGKRSPRSLGWCFMWWFWVGNQP